jgi:hypothetical protein
MVRTKWTTSSFTAFLRFASFCFQASMTSAYAISGLRSIPGIYASLGITIASCS